MVKAPKVFSFLSPLVHPPHSVWTFILVLLTLAPASSQQKFSIAFSPQAGDNLTYILNTSVHAVGKDFTGKDISLGLTASGEISFAVKSNIRDRVFMGLTTPGIQVDALTIQGPQSYTLRTNENMALQATFDRRGNVHDIDNIEALTQDRIMNISLIQVLRDYFPVLPGKMVILGETWNSHKRFIIPFQEVPLEVLVETRYTLQNVVSSDAGDIAYILVDYDVGLSGSKSLGEWTGHFKGKGTGNGLLSFLIQRGCFQEFSGDYKTEAALVIKREEDSLLEVPFHLTVSASFVMVN